MCYVREYTLVLFGDCPKIDANRDALGEGVVVSAFWVGVGGECLLGDGGKPVLRFRCIGSLA